jgi:Dna[CI] antecedent, DciA
MSSRSSNGGGGGYKPPYRANKPKLRPNGSPMTVASIMPEVSKTMNLPQKIAEMAVMALWPSVGPPQTKALGVKRVGTKSHLVIAAATPHVAMQLTYQLDGLLSRLNSYTPQTGLRLDKIVVRTQSGRNH